MGKYTTINIGPIFKTIQMARKPKELWCASYLFSLLMKYIIEQVQKKNEIILPVYVNNTQLRTDVGLYPDRLFVKGEVEKSCIDNAIKEFQKKTNLPLDVIYDYFNIMSASAEGNEIPDIIRTLNNKSDCLELFERISRQESEQKILDLIKSANAPQLLTNDSSSFSVNEMKDITSNGRKDNYSYDSYFCIVQGDGDNMGKIISSCSEDNLRKVSTAILEFGGKAVDTINKYAQSSMPIYAGGDDLLFIAPVIGNDGKNIFDLINEIDEQYKSVKAVADNSELQTSLSYGIAICYHKYPLYEAFDTVRNQLRKAKNAGKNSIALDLRKHSGGAFSMILPKSHSDVVNAFMNIIKESSDRESIVSAISYKLRSNDGLLKLWIEDDDYKSRNANFFATCMENSDASGNSYKTSALELLNVLYANVPDNLSNASEKIEWVLQNMYGMLRIAKFIKGEERHD